VRSFSGSPPVRRSDSRWPIIVISDWISLFSAVLPAVCIWLRPRRYMSSVVRM
jgi:hypothetical protein